MKRKRVQGATGKKAAPGKKGQAGSSGSKSRGKRTGSAKPRPVKAPIRSRQQNPAGSAGDKAAKLLAKIKKLQSANKKLFAALKSKKLNQDQPKKRTIEQRYERQVTKEREAKERIRGEKALKSFRVRKEDKGKIVFIGIHGQRNPQSKGRKGYAIIVDKNGKKTLIKQRRTGYRAALLSEVDVPQTKKNAKKLKEFQRSRLERLKSGQIRAPKGSGKIEGMRRGHDFNSAVINKIATSVKQTIEKQRGHRVFIITAIALIQLPDGSEQTVEIVVDIAKADQIAIEIGGIKNFVRRKFYGFFARELGFLGLVSSGSANHIRKLAENKGKARNKWVDTSGGAWAGRHKDDVKILAIEWKIEQAV